MLELNNTDAYLKVAEKHVPDLPVVTTRLQLRRKKFYLRKKLLLGKMAPNLSLNEFPLKLLSLCKPH